MAVTVKRGRPGISPAYGIHQDEQGLIDWSWVDERMTKSRNYWIVSVTPEGKPHSAPVWGVWMDGALYFGSAPSARKTKNLLAKPDVVVNLESGDETVILEGVVERVSDRDLLIKLGKVYDAKYPGMQSNFADDPDTYIFMLKPRKALAWLETDFPRTATRWLFD